MALRVRVVAVSGGRERGDKLLRVSFRGVSHTTGTLQDLQEGGDLTVGQTFEWPVARPIEPHETLALALLPARPWARRALGQYVLVLQTVARSGRLAVQDSLTDERNRPLSTMVSFEVVYLWPEGAPAEGGAAEPLDALDEEQQLLVDVEANIANLEMGLAHRRSLSLEAEPATAGHGAGGRSAVTPPPRKSRRSSTLHSLRSWVRKTTTSSLSRSGRGGGGGGGGGGGAQSSGDEEEKRGLLEPQSWPNSRPASPGGSEMSSEADEEEDTRQTAAAHPARRPPAAGEVASAAGLRAQDFQLCVTVIEARQLAGLNMDPVVCVQVGDQRRYTSVKESTNCPYYNEYFVFDFHMPPVMLFDKIITLSVLQSRNLLRANKLLGSFKLDVATVWAQTDHQFYHKWALLTDPEDPLAGPKGYLQVDLSVVGKGDGPRVPPPGPERDYDDIEANLLLPAGVPVERQRARFVVRIYRADGLPRLAPALLNSVRSALTGEPRDLVDPYVQVSFAGLTGRTSVRKHSYAPVWNEQLVFTEMFPPLCQRIKVQLRDEAVGQHNVIGTHFIHLKAISNEGEKGFLPTFGPTFVHLYGSPRAYSLLDEHAPLNAGLGEGVSYRARLLVAVRTEILDGAAQLAAPTEPEMEPCAPVNEAAYGKLEEFFLFGAVMDTTMIDKRIGDKPVVLELSLGNAGNSIDGHNESSRQLEHESVPEGVSSEPWWQSTTPSVKPMSLDKRYYFLPYWDDKPCVAVRSAWPDTRRRMYTSNALQRLADALEAGLGAAAAAVQAADEAAAVRRLKAALTDLAAAAGRFAALGRGASASQAGAAGAGRTKLDRERAKLCQREVEQVGTQAKNLKALVTRAALAERMRAAQGLLARLRALVNDPQPALPDVLLWLVSGGRRAAYARLPARDLLYSVVDEESGRHCGKVHTLFLKLPGKKGLGPGGWAVQAKVTIYTWLGLLKHKKHYVDGLPAGYVESHELRNADRQSALPPSHIRYSDKNTFQMRAHVYQARSLIGSDASGLSDPFCRVLLNELSAATRVQDETLSPTWDELLVLEPLELYGSPIHIREHPPQVVVEIFDQDQVGKAEFIGRCVAEPVVKLSAEPYARPRFPPALQWHELRRGPDRAGELLAAFELLQIPRQGDDPLPPLPDAKGGGVVVGLHPDGAVAGAAAVLPVPRGVRPTLATYRVEVLFWGLRDLKRVHLLAVARPRVDVECGGRVLSSAVIPDARRNPNFSSPVKYMDLELPEQDLYRPPLTIRAVDCRSFGRYTLVGTHTIASIHKYMWDPGTNGQGKNYISYADGGLSPGTIYVGCADSDSREYSPLLPKDTTTSTHYGTQSALQSKKEQKTEANRRRKRSDRGPGDDDDDSTRDWWTKYFASVEASIQEAKEAALLAATLQTEQLEGNPGAAGAGAGAGGQGTAPTQANGAPPALSPPDAPGGAAVTAAADHLDSNKRLTLRGAATAAKFVARLSPKSGRRPVADVPQRRTALLKVYPSELEAQPEFGGFREWLHTFELYRGKRAGDSDSDPEGDSARVVGAFKGSVCVYRWPPAAGSGLGHDGGRFQGLPCNDPIHVLVRVYVVRAFDLHPMDLNGKADPYVVLQLGSRRLSDKERYVSKQLNPVFGRCFEIEATFPQDSLLTVQVLDWDLVGADDLIGETRIDLENRFYSRHRATCGLAQHYEEGGYNAWRDPQKPTQILAKLCKDAKLEPPIYSGTRVRIGRQTFCLPEDEPSPSFTSALEERVALHALHRWPEVARVGCSLVPEHVETRPLFSPAQPGLERGRLQLWVDMFPRDMPAPPPPIDVAPRKPRAFELRVVVWNTDEVVLEDDAFFTGEKMSDIYVKGWLKGPEDCQCTDIHYRSLTGEGNFNWRFVYPFDYLVAEERMVISRKESLFSWDETECKLPARLELQVWDADHFSADDFLGAITLDLNRFPRGAKSARLCTLDMLKTDGSVPLVNIFRQRRVKGWWPFYVKRDNDEMELTGKVEAEIHLLTREEADKNPAGLGRNEPDPLDKPNRPDASFMWFLNPLKSIRYIVWHNYKWAILKAVVIFALAIVILLFFYSVPGYTVKKLIGA